MLTSGFQETLLNLKDVFNFVQLNKKYTIFCTVHNCFQIQAQNPNHPYIFWQNSRSVKINITIWTMFFSNNINKTSKLAYGGFKFIHALFNFLLIKPAYLELTASPLASVSMMDGWKYARSLWATRYNITFLPDSLFTISFIFSSSSEISACQNTQCIEQVHIKYIIYTYK